MVDTHVVAILDSMDDLDPASLFLRPGQDLEPVALDSAVYDSVNGGVTERTLDICIKDLPNTPVSLAKATSRQFHRPGKPGADHDPVQSNDSHHYTDEECNGTKSQAGVDFGAPDAWEKAGERDLEQRVFCIDQPSIFDSFFGTSTRSVLQSSGPADRLKTLTKEAVQKTPSGRHPSALRETQLFQESSGSDQDRASRQQQVNLDSEAYGHWNRRTVFGSLSHPAGAMSSLPGSHINGEESEASELEDLSEPPSFYREPVDLVFELPALSKRPRDILDEQLEIEGLESTRLSSQGKNSNQTTGKRRRSVSGRLAGSSRSPDQKSLKSNSKDLWRDAGKPMEQDTTTSGSKGGKAQLSWETGSKVGLLSQIDVPFVSPYITEAGTDCFEAIYQK
ncbi:hypothetical protein BGW38_003229 [Lunasporangiospora selenospora]|uniref:Uncharacterized protein n=1 Tax=Lunasporangiospora selenospora TaxID=979761 RepID=A0A9P6FT22_9FUNG|nr:hypothetical protein BGW38_003229 [Lunasporangiospora selenospora]